MHAGSKKRIGLGSANGRYFLFHVGIGFDAAVVEQVERRASLKRYAGHPLFVWTTLLTWARYGGRHKPRFAVRFKASDGESATPESVDGYLTICMNSNPYTFLGNRPFNLASDLTFDQGLAVITIRSLSLPTFAGVVISAMMSGRYLRHHPRTDFRNDVSDCEVVGYGKFPYQLDGDYLGDVDSLSLRHESEVLDVFMPIK
jgi:diacylglycerol kinase family enzyme